VTFQQPVYAVDANTQTGNFMRLMLQSSTLGSQGVVLPTDCLVSPTNPGVGAGITIASGAVVILGQETAFQGSYYGYNVGNDTSLSIAATGGSPRSDMIVARAEDPTFSGSPWGGPASGQIIFPRVISGVAGGSTTPPGGQSCIPLARIDMPASTSVVQSSYVHDLRVVCNPQRIMQLYTASGPASPVQTTTVTTVQTWPPQGNWSVTIPQYATTAVIAWAVNEIEWGADTTVRANLWPLFGPTVTSPNLTTTPSLVSLSTTAAPYRHTIGGGSTVAIPAAMRGTTQTLQFAWQTQGNNGTMKFAEGSSIWLLIEFQQLAASS